MIDPEIIFYFCAVAATVGLAIRSGSDTLQQIAAILFVGWGIYNPLNILFGGSAFLNTVLDIVLLWFMWGLASRTNSQPGRYVSAVFLVMLVWHAVGSFVPTGVYFRVYNGLFLAQLAIVIVASIALIRAAADRPNSKPPESGSHVKAQVVQWPMNPDSMIQPIRYPHALRSESRQSLADLHGMRHLMTKNTKTLKRGSGH